MALAEAVEGCPAGTVWLERMLLDFNGGCNGAGQVAQTSHLHLHLPFGIYLHSRTDATNASPIQCCRLVARPSKRIPRSVMHAHLLPRRQGLNAACTETSPLSGILI